MTRQRRLGLFGGSFDPLHNGHVQAAKAFIRGLDLDLLLFLPSGEPFRKKEGASAFEHRYAMCLLATENGLRMGVSDMEGERPGKTYTSDMLRFFADRDADAELFFLAASDVLERLPDWKESEVILRLATLGILTRPGVTQQRLAEGGVLARLAARGARIRFLDDPMPPVSSGQVRARIASGKPVDDLVPGPVAEYMAAHGLYRTG